LAFSRRILHDDEDVLLDAHPHWIRLLGPFGLALVVLAGCIATFVCWSSAPSWIGIMLAAVIVIAGSAALGRYISWRATALIVTTRRVIYRSGVLHRIGREIPIDRVQDVTYHQTLFERLVGCGRLMIESAGERGLDDIRDVRHPEVVQTIVNRAGMVSAAQPDTKPEPSRSPALSRIEELDVLRQRGILTEMEFVEKKQELLREI
jgi:membrane protein YdbS with pleckstrin-like domain